ncbi:hypothetical protein PQR01_34625, partial [Paraburkholderia rhynchosiae]
SVAPRLRPAEHLSVCTRLSSQIHQLRSVDLTAVSGSTISFRWCYIGNPIRQASKKWKLPAKMSIVLHAANMAHLRRAISLLFVITPLR